MMNSINHLFIGSSWLLVSQMIPKIISCSKCNHHFIILIVNDAQKRQYDTLFGTLSFSDYEYWEYIYNDSVLYTQRKKLYYLYFRLVFSGLLVHFNFIKRWLLVYEHIKKSNLTNLIIHSEINEIALFLGREKARIAWCCWGNIPYYPAISKIKFYSRKDSYYRLFLDNCCSIIVLTEADKTAFENFYGYKNVVCSSYSYIYNFDKLPIEFKTSNRILVGNSAFYLEDYLRLARNMNEKKGLHFTFMCSYGVNTSSDDYIEWQSAIQRELTPNNEVDFWTENISLSEFNKKISSYQVYVAPMKRQSGLGTATTAICLGVKCYFDGVNYSYYHQKGLDVNPIRDLITKNEKEILYITDDNRRANSIKIRQACGILESVSSWEKIYKSLE